MVTVTSAGSTDRGGARRRPRSRRASAAAASARSRTAGDRRRARRPGSGPGRRPSARPPARAARSSRPEPGRCDRSRASGSGYEADPNAVAWHVGRPPTRQRDLCPDAVRLPARTTRSAGRFFRFGSAAQTGLVAQLLAEPLQRTRHAGAAADARAYMIGRPIVTALAPSARAMRMSCPIGSPPSRSTSAFLPTALTTPAARRASRSSARAGGRRGSRP